MHCCCSVAQSCPTLCDPMDCSMPGLTIAQSLPKFMFIASVMPSSHLIHWQALLLLLSIFLASGTFPMSRLFTSDDQNTGASASASLLPVNSQSLSPLSLTGLISLLSKGLSGVFSSTTVQRLNSLALSSLWSSSHNRMWPLGKPWPWLYGPLSAE